MDKMLAEINMLCTITTTNRAFRPIMSPSPMNTRLIISEYRSRTILLEAKIVEKFAEEVDFLSPES